MGKEKIKEQFLSVFSANGGNISDACKAVKIARLTFYRWKKEDAEFAEKCEEVNEVSIDNVETALYKEALGGNTTAMIFYLKTKGKSRGYTERTEHSFAGLGGSIKVEISDVPPENPEPKDDEE